MNMKLTTKPTNQQLHTKSKEDEITVQEEPLEDLGFEEKRSKQHSSTDV